MSEREPSSADLAAAYAVGALDPEEARAFEAELARSPALQREVARYRDTAAQLPHAHPATPNPDLRERVVARVRQESSTALPSTRRGGWTTGLAWAAALTGLTVGVVQWNRSEDASRQLAASRAVADSLETRLERQQATLDELLGPNSVMLQLASTSEQPPSIRLFWNQETNNVVLQTIALDPTPAGRRYQLWFLPIDGTAPMPASMFDAVAADSVLIVPGPPSGTAIAGAAVTVEPVGGSTTPTPPILFLGTLD